MTTSGKIIAIILVVAAVAVFLTFFGGRNGVVTEQTPSPSPVATTSAPSAGLTPPRPAPKTGVSQPAAGDPVTVLLPQAGDAWMINTPHTIELNRSSGATGSILLLVAATKEVVGWVSPNWGDSQTSFIWDTQTVALTRSSSQRKPIQPGTYIIKAMFDTQVPDSMSGSFRVVDAGSPEIVTYSVRLKDFTVTPAVLTVRRGAKVIFINNDLKRQTISATGFGPFAIDAGRSFALDTATLGSGSYFYSSDLYLNRGRGTLIVE